MAAYDTGCASLGSLLDRLCLSVEKDTNGRVSTTPPDPMAILNRSANQGETSNAIPSESPRNTQASRHRSPQKKTA